MSKATQDELLLKHHLGQLSGPMKEWQSTQNIPPVLLLVGQSGIGKRTIALFLARWILCERGKHLLNPCEECPTCLKSKTGHEVNLVEIAPDSPEENSTSSISLKVEQFRKLKSTAGFTAHESQARVILIPNADRMTPQAANSMLKLLEEPPKSWIFLLTCHDQTLLLPTLLSRCQVLRLKPFTDQEIEALLTLSDIEPMRRKVCARLSQGSLGRALKFAENEAWEKRKEVFRLLEDPGQCIQVLLEWATQDTASLELLIDLLEQIALDLIRFSTLSGSSAPVNWIHADFEKELKAHVQLLSQKWGSLERAREFWLSQTERLAAIRQELSIPLNRKLLVQDILLPWLKRGPN